MDDKNISNQEKKTPLEVKIVAILSILFVSFPTILAIIKPFQAPNDDRSWVFMIATLFLSLFLIVAVCTTPIATTFLKGKNWVRIILLIFFVFKLCYYLWGCILTLPAFYLDSSSPYFPLLKTLTLTGVVGIVLSSSAIFYLIFNKKVKEFFKKTAG